MNPINHDHPFTAPALSPSKSAAGATQSAAELSSTSASRSVVTVRTPTHLSREQILDATDACLMELGYDGTTIRRIAKELDCAVGSIYRYFADKRALLAEVVQRRYEPVLDRIGSGAPLQSTGELYAIVSSEQPEQYRLMFWLASIGKKTHAKTLPLVVERIIEAWAQQTGDRQQAERYWAQIHGAITMGRRVDDLPPPAPLAHPVPAAQDDRPAQ